jgi:hypothetical protein
MPPNQQTPVYAGHCHSDRQIVFAIGVVLLVFGPAITGYHQASTIGLALIVLLQLKLNNDYLHRAESAVRCEDFAPRPNRRVAI